MARWLALAAGWLKPIYNHIRAGVLAGGYVQIDETPVDYLSPGHGSTCQGYFWACRSPGGEAFFHWATSRAASCLESILPADFHGIVQCDGYTAYPAHARTRQDLSLAACWAHVRRKFYEAKDSAPQHAGFILLQIGHLYRLEATLRQSQASPRLRQALRASHSRLVMERIGRTLRHLRHLQKGRSHLPQSAMGKAISYTLNLWPQLQVYLNDGRIHIDTNPVENIL
jgi:transposase